MAYALSLLHSDWFTISRIDVFSTRLKAFEPHFYPFGTVKYVSVIIFHTC